MFKFLKSSFTHDALESRPVPHPEVPATVAPPSVKPHADIQRELIRAVLKDTLRRSGIPFEWLTCEVVTLAQGSGTEPEPLQIQLMLMQWHELFLRYAPALEHQLLHGLDRYEPSVDHSKYAICWRFSPECGCPFTVMPPALVWAHEVAPEPVAQEPASVLDRRHARRPANAATASSASKPAQSTKPPGRGDDDYQRTELSPFR